MIIQISSYNNMENQMQAKKIVDILCQQHNELLSFKKQVIA